MAVLLLVIGAGDGLRSTPGRPTIDTELEYSSGRAVAREVGGDNGANGTQASGSRLPDCSHACGACFPCRRVMVSSKCSVAESCPVVYRCTCKGRYYHVPSN
ncbi:Protein EPIDERMAL PATTERNING FACTOR 2 [Platanthera zijinensis]|uniref:Epidermal patterning factor-like protein n=1 Tax=Platanthera zijinensis TaxID=2320716 RepID=A0AAP0AZ79_9ASPA